ncbi:hypothetical protein H8959_011195 [Pygathrix nigripes]
MASPSSCRRTQLPSLAVNLDTRVPTLVTAMRTLACLLRLPKAPGWWCLPGQCAMPEHRSGCCRPASGLPPEQAALSRGRKQPRPSCPHTPSAGSIPTISTVSLSPRARDGRNEALLGNLKPESWLSCPPRFSCAPPPWLHAEKGGCETRE